MTRWRALVCSLSLVGCAGWPSYPTDRPADAAFPSSTDPRSLVEVTWSVVDETEESAALAPGFGVVVRGAFDGTGWDPDAEPLVTQGASCGSSGIARASETGDYLGDVESIFVSSTVAAGLCVRVLVPDGADVGWDLLIFPVDSCDVPAAPLAVDGAVLGLDSGGPEGGFSAALPPGRYLVQWASYYPDDPEGVVGYSVGASLHPADPNGSVEICPLLPGESAP